MADKHYLFDPGHGGKDSGAPGNGLYEKNIVLYLAKKAKELMEANYEGIKITLSRTTDVFLELKQRTDLANKLKVDGLVSFHDNSSTNPSASGYETHIYTNVGETTKALANAVHKEVMAVYGGPNRGVKQSDFHMLRESNMKAILPEFLFISNASDAAKLKDTAFLDKLALAVCKGIAAHEGLKAKSKPVTPPPTTSKPTTPTDGKLYRVQIGAFASKENAEALEEKAKAAGFSTTIKYD